MLASNNNPYDIFSPLSQRNPVLYDRMRDEDPVHAVVHPQTGQTIWFLTRYDDCLAFLKDKRFGKEFRRRLPENLTGTWLANNTEDIINLNMLNLDDPAHTRLKSLVHLAFMPQNIDYLRQRLQDAADSLFDSIDVEVANGDEFDLTGRYINKFPLMSIALMLGIPESDFTQLFEWTQDMLSEEDKLVRASIRSFSSYLDEHMTIRRQQVDTIDDVLSAGCIRKWWRDRVK